MTPHFFEGADILYKGTSELPCEDMWAKRDGDVVVSQWWPSRDELDALLNGGSVELRVAGGMPPVTMGVV